MLCAPAHAIGGAIRHGCEPVARFQVEERLLFITSETSGIRALEDARHAARAAIGGNVDSCG